MNKYHLEILNSIKKIHKETSHYYALPDNYSGNNDLAYNISNPTLRKMTKEFLNKHKSISFDEYLELLNSIYLNSKSSTEKYIGGYLLEYKKEFRNKINPKFINKWLNNLYGWALIDSLCQAKFDSKDFYSNLDTWIKTLKGFNSSENISKRRASLVLLIKPMRDVYDKKISELAFSFIDNLKHEKEILITKAISWILREMTKRYKDEVTLYLLENEKSLPKIAVRETKKKLLTGKK